MTLLIIWSLAKRKNKIKKKRNFFLITILFSEKGDEIYDPYETLVQVQGKKRLISKIKSIPVIQDMRYVDKNKLSNSNN